MVSAGKGISMRTSPRKRARVDYNEVDYSEIEFNEVETAKKVKVKSKQKEMGKGNWGKEEKDLKQGSRNKKTKGVVKAKDCGGKEENNNENIEEGQIRGKMLQESKSHDETEDFKEGKSSNPVNKKKLEGKKRKGGAKSKYCGEKVEKNNEDNIEENQIVGETLQENKSQGKKVYTKELKRKIAERAAEVGNCAEVARQLSKTKEVGPISASTVRSIKNQVALWEVTKGGIKEGAKTQEDEEEAGAQLERDNADVGAGFGQGEKGMKEKETVEDPEISMVFDTRPKYEETKLSAGCMRIRILEMKLREIERKKKLLELEEDENARELQAEKERLKTTLEESLNPETSD